MAHRGTGLMAALLLGVGLLLSACTAAMDSSTQASVPDRDPLNNGSVAGRMQGEGGLAHSFRMIGHGS